MWVKRGSPGMAEKASQAGAHLNCILKKRELVREECSRKEEVFEQRLGAGTLVAGLSGSSQMWRTSRRHGQMGI